MSEEEELYKVCVHYYANQTHTLTHTPLWPGVRAASLGEYLDT